MADGEQGFGVTLRASFRRDWLILLGLCLRYGRIRLRRVLRAVLYGLSLVMNGFLLV